jgi:hypothetical protein
MADEGVSWLGVLWRVAAAMALVFLTYNPIDTSGLPRTAHCKYGDRIAS